MTSTSADGLVAVIFDLFHTLVDPEEFRPNSFHRADHLARRLGIEPTAFVEYWEATWPGRIRHRSPTARELVRAYCDRVGAPPSDALLDAALREAGRYQDQAIESPRPEVVQELRRLRSRGVRVGLLSNCDEWETRAWSRSPLVECFDTIGLSCDLGCAKPEPEAYRAVLRSLDVPAGRTAFVGDGGSEELSGARDCGFGLVVFTRMFVGQNGLRTVALNRRAERDADRTIDHISELRDLLLPGAEPGRRRVPADPGTR